MVTDLTTWACKIIGDDKPPLNLEYPVWHPEVFLGTTFSCQGYGRSLAEVRFLTLNGAHWELAKVRSVPDVLVPQCTWHLWENSCMPALVLVRHDLEQDVPQPWVENYYLYTTAVPGTSMEQCDTTRRILQRRKDYYRLRVLAVPPTQAKLVAGRIKWEQAVPALYIARAMLTHMSADQRAALMQGMSTNYYKWRQCDQELATLVKGATVAGFRGVFECRLEAVKFWLKQEPSVVMP